LSKIIFKFLAITFYFSSNYCFSDEINHKNTENNIDDTIWMNHFHETVSDSVYQSAAWFDDFFTEEGSAKKNPKINAKIRLEWRPRSRNWSDLKARFKVKVRLPHFKDRVDIILSDDDETEQNQLPLETTHIQAEEEKFSAALRYMHSNEKDKFTDTRVGISGGDIFIRSRHKRYINLNENNAFKIEPSVFYFLDEGLGSRLLLEYNFQKNANTQYRINYSIRGSESFSGIKWKHGIYKLKHLSDNNASVISLQIEGERNGERGFIVDNYTLSYRYRFNAYKKWLYFEVEPFLEWQEANNYSTTPGIALRVEGYFYKG